MSLAGEARAQIDCPSRGLAAGRPDGARPVPAGAKDEEEYEDEDEEEHEEEHEQETQTANTPLCHCPSSPPIGPHRGSSAADYYAKSPAEFRSAKTTLGLSSMLVVVYIVSWILMALAVNDAHMSVSLPFIICLIMASRGATRRRTGRPAASSDGRLGVSRASSLAALTKDARRPGWRSSLIEERTN